MKKAIFTLAITTLIAGTVLTGCQNSTKKEEAAQDNVEDARENLDAAKVKLTDARKEATHQEWEAFRASTDATITANEVRIAEMKDRMNNTGKTIDAEYAKRIQVLEQKNNDLKAKIESYKNDSKEDWNDFKQEFNSDMNELGQAFKNLTVKNN